jgi:hypothetical protein
MATLLFNTSNVAPIPLFTSNLLTIHNPNGVDAVLLKNALYLQYMPKLALSYNAQKSTWTSIKDIIALDESDLIETLTIHCYDADLSEKRVRKFDATKLVDFVPADLKNMKDYLKVLTNLFG